MIIFTKQNDPAIPAGSVGKIIGPGQHRDYHFVSFDLTNRNLDWVNERGFGSNIVINGQFKKSDCMIVPIFDGETIVEVEDCVEVANVHPTVRKIYVNFIGQQGRVVAIEDDVVYVWFTEEGVVGLPSVFVRLMPI